MTYKPRVVLDELGARDFKPSGLSGSTAASRYVGATTTGAPSSGTYATGDFVIAQNGSVWICTVAGSPGTWMAVAGGATGGSLLNWRGTWSSSASYAVNDVVLYATQLWVAAQSSVGATPQVTVPSYSATILADTPSIYWRLDEPSGSTAADSSGNGRTGTIIGGVTYAVAGGIAGDSDTAMRFNGSSGWVQGNTAFNNPTPVSVECWFKTTATAGLLVEFDSGSTQHDRAIFLNSDGTLSWFCWQVTTGTTITSPASYNDGNWHHVVGTVGSGGQLLYVDGAQVASSANTFPQNYSGHWEIANGPNGGFFNGTLDEVAIWNATQLTSSQVATHYNTGHSSSAYWTLLAVGNPMTAQGDLIYGGANGQPTRLVAGASNTLLAGGSTPSFTAAPTASGELTAQDFKPSGLSGATSASRYVGATASGAPTSGTFVVGDFVIDRTGKLWICTAAGTPGTWLAVAAGMAWQGTWSSATTYNIGDTVFYNGVSYVCLSQSTNDIPSALVGTGASVTYHGGFGSSQSGDITFSTAGGGVLAVSWNSPRNNCSVQLDGSTIFSTGGYGGNFTVTLPLDATNHTLRFNSDAGGGVAQFTVTGQANQSIVVAGVGTVSPQTKWATMDTSGFNNPMATAGDMIYGGASGVATRLAAGTSSQVLAGGTVPAFSGAPVLSGEVTASDFKAAGLSGAMVASRYVGGTTSGPPTSGTFVVGDYVVAQNGHLFVCTVAGTPGTWTDVGTAGGLTSPLTTKGDVWGWSTTNARQPVGADGTFLAADSSQAAGLSYRYPAGIAGLSTLSTQLSATVAFPTAGTWYDLLSLSLTAGTWLIIAEAQLATGGTGGTVSEATARIYDGTTTYASDSFTGSSSGYWESVNLQVIVTPTATTTYKLQGAGNANNAQGLASAATNVGTNATRLYAVQLTGTPASGPGALMPAVRCYRSTSLSPTNSTWTAIAFDTNLYDQGTGTAQHSTVTNNTRLTCQQAGVYNIGGYVQFSSAPSVGGVQILLNGATVIDELFINSPSAIDTDAHYKLALGDYVELRVWQNSSVSVIANGDMPASFWMARVDSGPGALQPNTKVQLDYVLTSNVSINPADATWTDFIGNQAFSVDDPNSVVEIDVSGYILNNGVADSDYANRLVVDSATTNITKMLGGGRTSATSGRGNQLEGVGTVTLLGLAAGSHTVKLQVYGSFSGANCSCNVASSPNIYSLNIRVLERKQSSSPPSSTPAPAVRCYNSSNISMANATFQTLTFDTNRFDQGTSAPQHSTSSNTSRLTCQQAGVYQVTASAEFGSSSSGFYRMLVLLLNGTTTIAKTHAPFGSGQGIRDEVTTMWQLAFGDYVEVQAYQDSGGALNVIAAPGFSPEFMMARVDSGGQGFVPIPMVKTANYTALATDSMLVAGANGLTFTLPAAGARAPGLPLVVKNGAFTNTTVARAGSDTVDGAASYVLLGQFESITAVSDGVASWWLI